MPFKSWRSDEGSGLIGAVPPDSPDDRAQRAHIAVENYLARRRELENALKDIAVLKHTLRDMAAELEPRMQGIEGRLVVLARTVGNLLAELDRGHTTAITRL